MRRWRLLRVAARSPCWRSVSAQAGATPRHVRRSGGDAGNAPDLTSVVVDNDTGGTISITMSMRQRGEPERGLASSSCTSTADRNRRDRQLDRRCGLPPAYARQRLHVRAAEVERLGVRPDRLLTISITQPRSRPSRSRSTGRARQHNRVQLLCARRRARREHHRRPRRCAGHRLLTVPRSPACPCRLLRSTAADRPDRRYRWSRHPAAFTRGGSSPSPGPSSTTPPRCAWSAPRASAGGACRCSAVSGAALRARARASCRRRSPGSGQRDDDRDHRRRPRDKRDFSFVTLSVVVEGVKLTRSVSSGCRLRTVRASACTGRSRPGRWRSRPSRPRSPRTRSAAAEAREVDVHPEDPGDERQRRRMTLKMVRIRRTSFWRCEITDSFVCSSASTTSL